MPERFYTLGEWRVREGSEEAFVGAWLEVGRVFTSLPNPPVGTGTLIQSLDDPSLYYSFGPWPDLDAIEAMRADPEAQRAIEELMALCTSASPGGFRVVAEVGAPPAGD